MPSLIKRILTRAFNLTIPAGSVPAPLYSINQVIRISPSIEFIVEDALLESDGINWYYAGKSRDINTQQTCSVEMTESAIFQSHRRWKVGKKL